MASSRRRRSSTRRRRWRSSTAWERRRRRRRCGPASEEGRMREIVVIGAAGLRAALVLCERGRERAVQVTVLEADSRVGGRIGSEQQGEWRVERGPATVQEGSPGLLPLIERLGLGGAAVTSDERADRRY